MKLTQCARPKEKQAMSSVQAASRRCLFGTCTAQTPLVCLYAAAALSVPLLFTSSSLLKVANKKVKRQFSYSKLMPIEQKTFNVGG